MRCSPPRSSACPGSPSFCCCRPPSSSENGSTLLNPSNPAVDTADSPGEPPMTPDRRQFILAGGAAVAASLTTEASAADAAPDRAKKFVAAHEAKVKPLEIAAAIAWWDANISGKDEDFKRKEDTQNKIDAALSDRAAFAELKELKAAV